MKALSYTPHHLRPKPQTKRQQLAAERREIEKHIAPVFGNSCNLVSRVLKNGRVAIAIGVSPDEYSFCVCDPEQAKQWAASLCESVGGQTL